MRGIIFLDFDGVMVTEKHMRAEYEAGRKRSGMGAKFDPEAVRALNRLITKADLDVVVSSTWRKFTTHLERILDANGVEIEGRFLGQTPCLDKRIECGLYTGAQRGDEIQAWLTANRSEAPFVILDDDSDMSTVAARHILTDGYTGLTEANVDAALALLR